MKLDQIKELKDEKFHRLTGVRKATLEKQLLMVLEYLREYRTYFHIGQNYVISESSAYRAVKWIEDTLVKHQKLYQVVKL
ncbi:IS5 family transposase ISOt6 [Orientia tsutsugamushi]|nr:IS5 family transposase ISOt6 [Orientia tsutsugamushi]